MSGTLNRTMNDAGVGRLLVASLHQGIADVLPSRLEFYESWLNPTGLREGRIGLAPLAAVLSFLRQEGEAYRLVAERAGEYSAEWTFADVPAYERTLVRALPDPIRVRLVSRIARRMVRQTYGGSRALRALAQRSRLGGHPRIDFLRGPRRGGAAALRVLCVGHPTARCTCSTSRSRWAPTVAAPRVRHNAS